MLGEQQRLHDSSMHAVCFKLLTTYWVETEWKLSTFVRDVAAKAWRSVQVMSMRRHAEATTTGMGMTTK